MIRFINKCDMYKYIDLIILPYSENKTIKLKTENLNLLYNFEKNKTGTMLLKIMESNCCKNTKRIAWEMSGLCHYTFDKYKKEHNTLIENLKFDNLKSVNESMIICNYKIEKNAISRQKDIIFINNIKKELKNCNLNYQLSKYGATDIDLLGSNTKLDGKIIINDSEIYISASYINSQGGAQANKLTNPFANAKLIPNKKFLMIYDGYGVYELYSKLKKEIPPNCLMTTTKAIKKINFNNFTY